MILELETQHVATECTEESIHYRDSPLTAGVGETKSRIGSKPSVVSRLCDPSLRFSAASETFDRYGSGTPLAYTLFRGAECSALARFAVERPVLDVGCSTGEFAAWAIDKPMEAGVDLSQGRLRHARAAGGHLLAAQADAARLPFANDSFASVLAVSVCEHFADPQTALAEAFRVLRPGGRFVATIVLIDIHEHLFYGPLCRRLGLCRLARVYERLHDQVFGHVALYQREVWEKMLLAAGFRVVVSRKIVSPRLTAWFDFWLITAWPYKLMQWLGMRPLVWRPRWVRRLCWKWFQLINDECSEKGIVLLVVAEKPG